MAANSYHVPKTLISMNISFNKLMDTYKRYYSKANDALIQPSRGNWIALDIWMAYTLGALVGMRIDSLSLVWAESGDLSRALNQSRNSKYQSPSGCLSTTSLGTKSYINMSLLLLIYWKKILVTYKLCNKFQVIERTHSWQRW